MDRRTFVKGSAAVIGAASLPQKVWAQADAPSAIRFGAAIGLSGPLAGASMSTSVSQYQLWQKRINDAGGLMLSKYDKRVPIELILYDTRFDDNENIKLTEKLILDDQVDMVLSPWGTQWNLAAAPIVNRHEYPVIFTTAAAEMLYTQGTNWPYAFWSLSQPIESTQPLVEYVAQLKSEGKVEGKVAAIFDGFELGLELDNAFVDLANEAGLDLVFNESFPQEAGDLQPLLRRVMATEPEAFFAFTYPPSTFAVTGAARTLGFSPDLFYVGIGGVFPGFREANGGADGVEGVLAYGAQDPDAPGYAEYAEALKATFPDQPFGQEPEAGGVQVYAHLQVVEQAIERVGEIDRPKIRDAIAEGATGTLYGDITWKDQLSANPWSVGQWQGGRLVGVFPADKQGAKPVLFPKPKWAS